MKKIIFLALLVVLPLNSFAQDQTGEEDCKTEAVLEPAKNLIDELDAVTGKFIKTLRLLKSTMTEMVNFRFILRRVFRKY